MTEEKKKLTIRVEKELHKALQHYIVDADTTIQELTVNLYRELLEKNGTYTGKN